ncbi:MAG: hypothetical protein ACPLZC_06290 [Candidatus Bathyarchaeales archaeon]
MRMIQALSTSTTKDGNTVLVDGFYENVAPPSQEDLELVEKLAKTFDEETTKKEMKVKRFIKNIHGKEAMLKYLYSPTLNIDGIWGGIRVLAQKLFYPTK